MDTFTVFFCGTGSNSFDFAHTNYHKGELISTLARNHPGHEFVDWIIVDGPGSGNLQEAEKWVPSGDYSDLVGTLTGAGWEENVKHAVAVLLGVTQVNRTAHTPAEIDRLRRMGVGVDIDTRPTPNGLPSIDVKIHPLHARISPQALQQKKTEILRRGKVCDTVNVIGWSRGGVTCHMFANALAETPGLSGLKVNIFACDPVPGEGQFDAHRIQLRDNVRNYVAIYSMDERSRGFSPILPYCVPNTTRFITTIPGRHATLVGNAAVDGDTGFNDLFAPGIVTRDLAEKYLTRWGTPLVNTLNLSDPAILKQYDAMIGQASTYTKMHDISYTALTQWGERAVGQGDGTFTDFGSVDVLKQDPHFVNSHHRALFAQCHGAIYQSVFSGNSIRNKQLMQHWSYLKSQYPNLAAKWEPKPEEDDVFSSMLKAGRSWLS